MGSFDAHNFFLHVVPINHIFGLKHFQSGLILHMHATLGCVACFSLANWRWQVFCAGLLFARFISIRDFVLVYILNRFTFF